MSKVYTIIESGRAAPLSLRELWRFRELFWMLAWRNIIVRYKQTVLGLLWTLSRPLATVAAFYVLFHRIAKLPDVRQVPYPMLVFSGVMLWQFCNSNTYTGTVHMPGRPRGFNNKGLLDEYRRPKAAWRALKNVIGEWKNASSQHKEK